MTRARDAATNSHVATFVHPTGAGNQHVPASGAAGQALLYASAGTAAWGTISTGVDDVVFPNLASPNNTYTASGTWSKGSLSDDDYVWIYLVGGGAGGRGDSGGTITGYGGYGGSGKLIYGKAKFLDGGAYVIGSGTAGAINATGARNPSTFTLSSGNGGAGFTTAGVSDSTIFSIVDGPTVTQSVTLVTAGPTSSISFLVGSAPTGWAGSVIGSSPTNPRFLWTGGAGGTTTDAQNSIFGGGGGGSHYNGSTKTNGGSLYAGAGGVAGSSGVAGTYPGGGGGGSSTYNNVGGTGANGNVRVYHV